MKLSVEKIHEMEVNTDKDIDLLIDLGHINEMNDQEANTLISAIYEHNPDILKDAIYEYHLND